MQIRAALVASVGVLRSPPSPGIEEARLYIGPLAEAEDLARKRPDLRNGTTSTDCAGPGTSSAWSSLSKRSPLTGVPLTGVPRPFDQ
jgi:hypothetical protein